MRQAKLSFESLERRELMAGDVTAVLRGNSIFITEAAGQAGGDNGVFISQTPEGLIKITGDFPNGDGPQSKVNGGDSVQFRGNGRPMSLFVNFGAGNDQVTFDQESTPLFNKVTLDLGAPPPVATRARTTGLQLGTVITPLNPPDVDDVHVGSIRTLGSMTINTGPGEDRVFMGNFQIGESFPFLPIFTKGNLTINTGAGEDTVFLQSNTGEPQSKVTGAINIQTFKSSGETSASDVFLTDISARGPITVRTGAGVDTVHMDDTTSRKKIDINTGGGDDTATLIRVATVDRLFARMGSGNDTLSVDGVLGRMTLLGEAGDNDRLTTHDVSVQQITHSGWEFINGRRNLGLVDLVTDQVFASRG